MSKFEQYSSLPLSSLKADDLLAIVDVHDTTMSANGTTKSVTAGTMAGLYGVPTFPVQVWGSVASAISAAQTASGGVVLLPPAQTWVETLPQITGNGITIRGQGASSVIQLAPAGTVANGQTIGLWVNGGTNIVIEELTVDANFTNVAKDGGTVIPSTFAGGTGALGAAVTTTPAAGTTETWTVNSAASTASAAYSAPFAFKVDSEWLLCTGGFGTTSWTVRRGFSQGTPGSGAIATHANSAAITSTNGILFDSTITKYGSGTPKTYLSSTYAGGVDASTYLHYRMPIRITNAQNVVVRNCRLMNSISAGVLADATSVNGCQDITVEDCRISSTWDNAVYFHQGVQYANALNNRVSDVMYNGACAVYCDHVLFEGNNIRNCGPSFSDGGGIQVNGSSNCDVTGNLIDNACFYGIEAEATQETNITGGAGGNQVYAYNTVIANNLITNCHSPDYPTHSSAGVNVFGAHKTAIGPNIIDNCDFGVSIGSQATRTTIGAQITNCKSLGINVGNSADVIQTVINGAFVGWNGSHGAYANAPCVIRNSTFIGNTGMGVNLSSPPSGIPRKIDYIVSNFFADNTDSGILVGGGATALAVIEKNVFANSQGVLFYDGASNGTTTFTSSTAAFTASDVGKTLVVLDQGTNGTTTSTTISAYVSATQVTLAASLPGTQTGLTFMVGRGPGYYTDGATTTASNSVLTSATAAFTSNDVGLLVVLTSLDPIPVVLGVATVSTYTSATQVSLNSDFGTLASCAFFINRSAGQQTKAINNFSGYPVIERDNTVYGMPEYQGAAGVVNKVQTPSLQLIRRPIADHAYTINLGDQLIAFTSLTSARAVTVKTGFGSVTEPYYMDIKDESGSASGTNIISLTGSGCTIDGQASVNSITTAYGSVRIYSNGTNWFTR